MQRYQYFLNYSICFNLRLRELKLSMSKAHLTTETSNFSTNMHSADHFESPMRPLNDKGPRKYNMKRLNLEHPKTITIPSLHLNATEARMRSNYGSLGLRHQKSSSLLQDTFTTITKLNSIDNDQNVSTLNSEVFRAQLSKQEPSHQQNVSPRFTTTTEGDSIQVRESTQVFSPRFTSRTGSMPQVPQGSMTHREWRPRNDFSQEQKNIRSYPSKRLIFQQKIEMLKAKIQEKEDINLGEYKDLEDWFETLHLKYNEVLFSNTFDIYIYAHQLLKETWRPSGREGATLNRVGDLIILYGGVSTGYTDEIAFLEPRSDRWFLSNSITNKPNFNRYGHSAVTYHTQLVIFGGEKQYIKATRSREVLDEVWVFDVKQEEFSKLTHSYHGKKRIKPRKHHAATINNNKMYVYGGIGDKGQYFSDLWELNVSK